MSRRVNEDRGTAHFYQPQLSLTRAFCCSALLCLMFLPFPQNAWGAPTIVLLEATDQGDGGILLETAAEFSFEEECNPPYQSYGTLSLHVEGKGYQCGEGTFSGYAYCSKLVNRAHYHGINTVYAWAKDCMQAQDYDEIEIEYDNTPHVVDRPNGATRDRVNGAT